MNPKSYKEYKINTDFKQKQLILNKLFKKNCVRMKTLQADLRDTREVMVQDFDEKPLLELKRLKYDMKKNVETQESITNDIKRDIKILSQFKYTMRKINSVIELLHKASNDDQFFKSELKHIDAGIRKIQKETYLLESMVEAY